LTLNVGARDLNLKKLLNCCAAYIRQRSAIPSSPLMTLAFQSLPSSISPTFLRKIEQRYKYASRWLCSIELVGRNVGKDPSGAARTIVRQKQVRSRCAAFAGAAQCAQFTEALMETNENKNESAASEKKSKSSFREWFGFLSGLVLVLVTAALYGVGKSFRSGYLHALGLDLEQLPEDFHAYLFWGFRGGIRLFIGWMIIVLVAASINALGAWSAERFAPKWKWLRRLLTWWDTYPNVPAGARHAKYMALAFATFAFLYVAILASYILPQAFDAGLKKAQDELTLLASAKSKSQAESQWIELHFGQFDERIERGYRLLCTDKLCSIYDPAPEMKAVRVIPLDGLKEIRVFTEMPKLQQK
jgi:hypothetical protein